MNKNELEILRIINNQRAENQKCSFNSRGSGLGDFAKLELLLRRKSGNDIAYYIEIIEDMRKGHLDCYFCSMKILAYCEIFTKDRDQSLYHYFRSEYEVLLGKGDRFGRNYREEVREAIRNYTM